MIRNKSNVVANLQWNGKKVALGPGQIINVGEHWNVFTREVQALEARFVAKFPNQIELYTPENANAPLVDVPPPPRDPRDIPPPTEEPEAKKEEAPAEDEGSFDPYKKRALKDHSKTELQAMAKTLGITKWDEKTTKAKLIELVQARLDKDAEEE